MIVNRITHVVKRGRMGEAIALIKDLTEKLGTQGRILVCQLGTVNRLALEAEYESMAQYEKKWAEMHALPDTAAFYEKWYDLTETGTTNEIWELVE